MLCGIVLILKSFMHFFKLIVYMQKFVAVAHFVFFKLPGVLALIAYSDCIKKSPFFKIRFRIRLKKNCSTSPCLRCCSILQYMV